MWVQGRREGEGRCEGAQRTCCYISDLFIVSFSCGDDLVLRISKSMVPYALLTDRYSDAIPIPLSKKEYTLMIPVLVT